MLYACLGKSEPAQSGPDGTDGPEPRIVQDKSEVTVKAEDIRAATDKVTTEDRGGHEDESRRACGGGKISGWSNEGPLTLVTRHRFRRLWNRKLVMGTKQERSTYIQPST